MNPELSSFASDLRYWAATTPDAEALVVSAAGVEETAWTYAELDRYASRAANALAAFGATPGARVAHLGRNRAEYVALMYGASKLRCALVGLNWRFTEHELAPLLADSAPAVLVVDDEFLDVASAAVATADVDTALVGPDALIEAGEASEPGEVPTADDIALIFYTSGTTGVPKGAMLPVGALAENVDREAPWSMRPGSSSLVCSPVFHTAGTGWIYLPLHFGARCVLLRDPNPTEIGAAIGHYRITQALLVPAVIQMLLDEPSLDATDFASLEHLVYGASPIAAPLLARALDTFGCGFVQAYGMTETGGPITYLRPDDHDVTDPDGRLRSAGRPPGGVEIRVVDPDSGEPRPTGDTGEVWTRSSQQMVGYLNRPDATEATLVADGWLRTGDAGHLDDDGYLYLTDRLSDVIVSGAENVYPVEVEHVLMSHPGVAEVAVIGVPDERWGETVRAVVVPTADTDTDGLDTALIAFARDRLAHYKAPRYVEFVDELPRNPAGKVLRRELRAPHWDAAGRMIG